MRSLHLTGRHGPKGTLHEELDSVDLPGLSVDRVACKRSLCRIRLRHRADARMVTRELMDLPSFGHGGLVRHDEDGRGPETALTAYAFRDGTRLEDFMPPPPAAG